MWISKKEYNKIKQERNEALYDSAINKDMYSELLLKMLSLQKKYNVLKEKTLKLFEVEIYLQILTPIIYNIKASTPEEAEQCAINIFTNKNKDFSTSDIIMITVHPKNCAR